jgi:hypothetical protein
MRTFVDESLVEEADSRTDHLMQVSPSCPTRRTIGEQPVTTKAQRSAARAGRANCAELKTPKTLAILPFVLIR